MSKEAFSHMHLDIRGALNIIHDLTFFDKKDGTPGTDREAREYLYDCLAKGWKFLPIGECDNFCYQTGCKGHTGEKS